MCPGNHMQLLLLPESLAFCEKLFKGKCTPEPNRYSWDRDIIRLTIEQARSIRHKCVDCQSVDYDPIGSKIITPINNQGDVLIKNMSYKKLKEIYNIVARPEPNDPWIMILTEEEWEKCKPNTQQKDWHWNDYRNDVIEISCTHRHSLGCKMKIKTLKTKYGITPTQNDWMVRYICLSKTQMGQLGKKCRVC